MNVNESDCYCAIDMRASSPLLSPNVFASVSLYAPIKAMRHGVIKNISDALLRRCRRGMVALERRLALCAYWCLAPHPMTALSNDARALRTHNNRMLLFSFVSFCLSGQMSKQRVSPCPHCRLPQHVSDATNATSSNSFHQQASAVAATHC